MHTGLEQGQYPETAKAAGRALVAKVTCGTSEYSARIGTTDIIEDNAQYGIILTIRLTICLNVRLQARWNDL